jgi:hypothetical protein
MYSIALLHEAKVWAHGESPDTTVQAFAIAKWVIQDILGDDWFQKNLGNDCKGPFFRMDEAPNEDGSFTLSLERTISRAVSLGENLFNLQQVAGFGDIVKKFKDDPNTEANYCELEVGALLRMLGFSFQFVKESNIKERDFDILLDFHANLRVPVESKCKLDKTDLSSGTIKNTLDKARLQLPRDGKSFIFMKVPQEWILDEAREVSTAQALIQTSCEAFLARSKRVASIMVYSFFDIEESGGVQTGFKLHEIQSKQPEYSDDSKLFGRSSPQVPNPQWIRFFEFVH